jgi:hypothetical protein
MRVRLIAGILTGLALLFTTSSVQACGYGLPNPFARFTLAECVIVGKVLSFDGQLVSAAALPQATEKTQYAVAEVEIVQTLKWAEGLTHVRVGFMPNENLHIGQVGCFFLNPHFAEAFYVMPRRYGLASVRDNNPGFDAELKQYERWGKLLRDPIGSLQSENAEERYLTAALLLSEYNTFQPGVHVAVTKKTAIDAKQSKLILLAIANVEWSKVGRNMETLPAQLFNQLGVTPKQGWTHQGIKTAKDFEDAAKKWLKNNAETYRIKAFVRI